MTRKIILAAAVLTVSISTVLAQDLGLRFDQQVFKPSTGVMKAYALFDSLITFPWETRKYSCEHTDLETEVI